MPARKLVLKRDVLTEIDSAGLGRVVGGAPVSQIGGCGSWICSDTCYSCYTVISCHVVDCVTNWTERVTTAIG